MYATDEFVATLIHKGCNTVITISDTYTNTPLDSVFLISSQLGAGVSILEDVTYMSVKELVEAEGWKCISLIQRSNPPFNPKELKDPHIFDIRSISDAISFIESFEIDEYRPFYPKNFKGKYIRMLKLNHETSFVKITDKDTINRVTSKILGNEVEEICDDVDDL